MNAAGSRVETSADSDAQRLLIARIDAWLVESSTCGAEVASREQAPEGALDLEAALHTQPWTDLAPAVETRIDRLRKKVEVARKLCRYYLPDLSRAAAPRALSNAGVRRLCGLLLKAAMAWRDPRYLNSALKLLDGVLGREDCAFPDELRALAREVLDALVPPAPRAR